MQTRWNEKGFWRDPGPVLPWESGEKNENNAASHYSADGLAGRYDSRLRHS
jgi:hypothetical protein